MTRAITLTEPIARAIAQDAANRQMRKRCETSGEPHVWDEDDYNLACETLERIWIAPMLSQWRERTGGQ